MSGFEPLFEQNVSISLGALAAVDIAGTSSRLDAAQLDGYWIKQLRIAAAFAGKTAGEGPILWGYALNFENLQAIEDYFEDDPQDSGAPVLRGDDDLVRICGMISEEKTAGNALDGVPFIEESLGSRGWTKRVDRPMHWWAYNLNGGALTTGMNLKVAAQFLGRWTRD